MSYTVAANIYSEELNTYLDAHWEAGPFEDSEEAYDCFLDWMPPKKEVLEAIRDEGCDTHYELEIGVWDNDTGDLADDDWFWNETVYW